MDIVTVDLGYDPQSCAGPVNYDEITFTERTYEFQLDPTYIQQLERCNGGIPEKRYFAVPSNVKVIERFLCVTSNVSTNEQHGWNDMGVVITQIEDRLGEFMVPFAALFAGDYLCFDGENSDPPKIVVWDHERSRAGAPITTPVADDFTTFLSLLYADD